MDLSLSIAPSVVELDVAALVGALAAHGHRVQRGAALAVAEAAVARRYPLADGRHEAVLATVAADGAPALAVHVRPTGEPLEPWREQGLICRPSTGWDSHPRAAIEEGPGYLRLVHLLDEFALVHLGSARLLADRRWADGLRVREEPFGGLVFSPRTSLLVELDPARFAAVVAAHAAGRPGALADSLAEPALRELVGGLIRIGALVAARAAS